MPVIRIPAMNSLCQTEAQGVSQLNVLRKAQVAGKTASKAMCLLRFWHPLKMQALYLGTKFFLKYKIMQNVLEVGL